VEAFGSDELSKVKGVERLAPLEVGPGGVWMHVATAAEQDAEKEHYACSG
jgi:hypothetical protein